VRTLRNEEIEESSIPHFHTNWGIEEIEDPQFLNFIQNEEFEEFEDSSISSFPHFHTNWGKWGNEESSNSSKFCKKCIFGGSNLIIQSNEKFQMQNIFLLF
jgi:hypothetical protein